MASTPTAMYLDTQAAFLLVWKRLGLQTICPLTFDEPDEASCRPPHAKGMISRVGEWRYVKGETVRLQVDLEIRIPEGSTVRRKVEEGMSRIVKYGRKWGGIVEWKNANARVTRDQSRYAGSGVDLIPAAWELWVDVEDAN